ncbi:MAG TPA: AAA family ATPase [Kiritimatiellia bacterium]|nr:AAA family ATPase [Kiritimatiellia bacterium]HPS08322.1 AAA family ATPase [Kiritimatiellia bacterium]
MWIQSLTLRNIRSFAEAKVGFSKRINVLVGPNNAGKSTILLPLLGLQEGLPHPGLADVRLGETEASAEMTLGDCDQKYFRKKFTRVWYQYRKDNNDFPLLGAVEGKNQPEGVNKAPGTPASQLSKVET